VRLIQVTVPAGKLEGVLGALDEEGVDYVVTDEASGREVTSVVSFPVPRQAVEPVLERLREAGIDDEAYTVVLAAETVVSRNFEELREAYEEERDEDRIAREELVAQARGLAPSVPTYLLMTVVSAVIAAAGLLLDSPAVVVGSMVIAPLIGPAMSTAVGSVVNDREMFARGVRLQVLGVGAAVVAALAFGLLVKLLNLVPPGLEITAIPQVQERLAPDFLSLAVALGAGVAGVVSLSTGVSAALVGVMIAVALLPPAATVGLGVAWGLPMVSLGAGVLALVNGLSINLAALSTLWYKGYRPEHWFRESAARAATVKRVGVLLAAIAVLSVFLGGVTVTSYQHATFEQQAQGETAAVVDTHEGLTLQAVTVQYGDSVLFGRPTSVVVTVGHEPGTPYPPVAETLDRRIDGDVAVEVRFVETARSYSKGSSGS
jgi:uncharacterized hydrophobic protein (TIGR00341 family)